MFVEMRAQFSRYFVLSIIHRLECSTCQLTSSLKDQISFILMWPKTRFIILVVSENQYFMLRKLNFQPLNLSKSTGFFPCLLCPCSSKLNSSWSLMMIRISSWVLHRHQFLKFDNVDSRHLTRKLTEWTSRMNCTFEELIYLYLSSASYFFLFSLSTFCLLPDFLKSVAHQYFLWLCLICLFCKPHGLMCTS